MFQHERARARGRIPDEVVGLQIVHERSGGVDTCKRRIVEDGRACMLMEMLPTCFRLRPGNIIGAVNLYIYACVENELCTQTFSIV